MGIVISLEPHRIKKEWKEEKRLLQDLDVQEVKSTAEKVFTPVFHRFQFPYTFLEEACVDLALESFLSGGKYSRYVEGRALPFTFQVQAAAAVGEIAGELYEFMQCWVEDDPGCYLKEMKEAVDSFIVYWWKRGLETGVRRQPLDYRKR
ncbi:DUF2521 family protein [Salibacterium halotolerans]|uniref:DUF2521 family protein n=1 Tax=Salibacterium halotolerans TaxID=1884432 RepID=A0A1I5WGP3_9BACI|nr:DUF2521 family protein [Salibacterium halotolerans]SFQ18973.1 Protein of unknown function [Salibacterium halotolerans]